MTNTQNNKNNNKIGAVLVIGEDSRMRQAPEY